MKSKELIEFSLPFYDGTERTVRVYLPEHNSDKKLPVIYMTDGQNIFEDGRQGQFGCWYTRETLDEEKKISGRSAIIVGIHNDADDIQRTSELLPKSIGSVNAPPEVPEERLKQLRQEGDLFDDFIINTVMPAVESRFPVECGRNATAFCGSSSGGLQAFFTAVSHPDIFSMSGVFSPAFPLFKSDDIVSFTKRSMKDNMPYLYFYSGSADPLEEDICKATEEVYDSIKEFYPLDRLRKVILPECHHHESAWSEVFKDFLHTFLDTNS